jgi:lipopolysaccharide heptosyltransferase II
MKILQILPELNVGGVETGTLDLSKQLVSLGHKVVVVSNGGILVADLESQGAKHYKLPVNKKNALIMPKMVLALAEIIKKEEIDIVHARSRVPGWIAYFACLITRRVFITTCHGYYSRHPFSYVMGWAKKVIVISNIIARHMIDDFGVPFERIRLIPRSVDLERFKFSVPDSRRKQEFNVGIIGRLTPIKGHLCFIKAMAKVSRVIPRIKIWIVGDAPHSKLAYKEQVQLLVKRLGLWHYTEFLGTQKEIPAVLENLDLLVLATTTHEAFGRVIIEAQASGVPVVATRVGGVVDIIEDEKTGLLVPPADPESMARAIIRMYKDPQLGQKLSQAAYVKVKEKYTLEKMTRATLSVYEEALQNLNILVIKFSSLGDVILSSAGLKAIREKFPGNHCEALSSGKTPQEANLVKRPLHKLSVLVGSGAKDVLLNCPYIDELLVCDFKNKDKGLRGFFRLAGLLRKKSFDVVVDLQNSRKSHLLSFLSGGMTSYGYDRKLGFLLNRRIKDDGAVLDPVAHQFRILRILGIDYNEEKLEVWPSRQDKKYIDDFLASQWISSEQKLVGINLSASRRWASKDWPADYIVELGVSLAKNNIRAVMTGTQEDIALAEQLIATIKEGKPINACGKTTVNQLAYLIKLCNAYISCDSAPLHIACAVGTPFVALFGPTDHRRHLFALKNAEILKKDFPCAPCYKAKCNTKECMLAIKPQEVAEAIFRLLK